LTIQLKNKHKYKLYCCQLTCGLLQGVVFVVSNFKLCAVLSDFSMQHTADYIQFCVTEV